MSAATQRAIAFVALNDVMQPDYRAVVARRALTFRRQAPLAGRERFDAAIEPFLRAQSLDDSSVVSVSAVNTLVEACQHDDSAMRAVLSLWQQSQQPLARRMREFLVSQQLETYDFDALDSGFLGTRPQEQMLALVNDFHTRNPAFNAYDSALMLCCIHGYLPGASATQPVAAAPPATPAPTLDEVPRSRWHDWFDTLQALPLDAPEWDERSLRAYSNAVQHLVEQRLAERQAMRGRLEHVLVLLREQATDELAYFGIGEVQTWDAGTLPLGEVVLLAETVNQFYAQLLAHRSSLQQAPAPTRAAQSERRRELDALEEQIIANYGELRTHFVAAPPAQVASEAPAEAPTATEAPALAEAPTFIEATPMPVAAELTEPTPLTQFAQPVAEIAHPVAPPVAPAPAEEEELDAETANELMLTVGGSPEPQYNHDLPALASSMALNQQRRGGFFRRRP